MTTIFNDIRASCAKLVAEAKHVKINEEAIKKIASELDVEKISRASQDAVTFPLKFANVEAEIDFLCLRSLLNFGSGYRKELHAAGGKGAFETIAFGCMGLYLTKNLDADGMINTPISEVGQLFNIPLDVEVEVAPAAYISKPHPLRPLADAIRYALEQTGATLRARQCNDFAAFIQTIRTVPLTADAIVRNFASTFPAFNDRYVEGERTVLIFKKAQLVAAELFRQLRQKDARFNFPDMDQLTALADNVLPAVLRRMGVLELSAELAATIDAGQPLPAGLQESCLRAAAIVACDQMVAAVNERGDTKIRAVDLDYYLWQLGKNEEYRSVTRHATKDTVFY